MQDRLTSVVCERDGIEPNGERAIGETDTASIDNLSAGAEEVVDSDDARPGSLKAFHLVGDPNYWPIKQARVLVNEEDRADGDPVPVEQIGPNEQRHGQARAVDELRGVRDNAGNDLGPDADTESPPHMVEVTLHDMGLGGACSYVFAPRETLLDEPVRLSARLTVGPPA